MLNPGLTLGCCDVTAMPHPWPGEGLLVDAACLSLHFPPVCEEKCISRIEESRLRGASMRWSVVDASPDVAAHMVIGPTLSQCIDGGP